jgi:hypothetical protein
LVYHILLRARTSKERLWTQPSTLDGLFDSKEMAQRLDLAIKPMKGLGWFNLGKDDEG